MISAPSRSVIEQMIADVQAGPESLDKQPALAKLQAQLEALPPEESQPGEPDELADVPGPDDVVDESEGFDRED